MARKKKLSNFYKVPKDKTNYSRPEGAGNFDNMDDFNVVKAITITEGSIQNTPTADKHIVNKEYVDDNFLSLSGGTVNGTVDFIGGITIDKISKVRVTKNNVQTFTDATIEIIEYDDEVYDELEEYDNSTNYRFTATVAGYYDIGASIITSAVAWTSGDAVTMAAYKNGNLFVTLSYNRWGYSETTFHHAHGSSHVYLAAGDYIDFRINITRGANTASLNYANQNYCYVHRLS